MKNLTLRQLRYFDALALDCSCSAGCPACIGPEVGQSEPSGAGASDSSSRGFSRKQVIAELLAALGVVATH